MLLFLSRAQFACASTPKSNRPKRIRENQEHRKKKKKRRVKHILAFACPKGLSIVRHWTLCCACYRSRNETGKTHVPIGHNIRCYYILSFLLNHGVQFIHLSSICWIVSFRNKIRGIEKWPNRAKIDDAKQFTPFPFHSLRTTYNNNSIGACVQKCDPANRKIRCYFLCEGKCVAHAMWCSFDLNVHHSNSRHLKCFSFELLLIILRVWRQDEIHIWIRIHLHRIHAKW